MRAPGRELFFAESEMSMKIRSALVLTCALLALVVSAQAQRTRRPQAATGGDYYPLRVGDSWKYRMVEENAEFTVKVLSEEKQADGTVLYMVEKLSGVKVNQWYSKPSGWVLLNREAYPEHEGLGIKHEPAKQFLKNPLTAGARWNWSGKSTTLMDMTESNRVLGPDTVKVPAGTFRAMKVVTRVSEGPGTATKTYWYADGVGLVKYMTESGPIKYTWELVDYSFKKAASNRR